MKIQNIHIDGFGHFNNTQFTNLSPGLTVFQGPNEAGKSTLLAFISFILFGASAKRSENKYEPLQSSKHGGQLQLLAQNNTTFTLTRHRPKHSAPIITDSTGSPVEPHIFKSLLGDADEKIFRSVFAFTLDELASIDSLKESGAQDRIFSASIAGANRSPHLVIKDLDKQADAFMKTRLSPATGLGKIKNELTLLTQQLQEARRLSQDYAPKKQEAVAAETTLQTLTQSLAKLNQQRDQIKRFIAHHGIYLEARDATTELNALPPHDPAAAEQLALDTTTAQTLTAESKTYRTQLTEIANLNLKLESQQNAINQSLSDLGPDWTPDRLTALDTSLATEDRIREFEHAQNQLQQTIALAQKDAAGAQRNHQQALSEVQNMQRKLDALPPVDDEHLRRAQPAARRLRVAWTELATLQGSLETRLQNAANLQPESPAPSPNTLQNTAIPAALAIAAVGGAYWRWSLPDTFGATILLLLSAASAYAAWRANAIRIASNNPTETTTPSAAEAEIENTCKQVNTLTDELEELLAVIGINHDSTPPNTVTALVLEEADEHLNHLRQLAQQRTVLTDQLVELTRRADEAAVELKAVTAESTTAQTQETSHTQDWLNWHNQWGIPTPITPAAATRLIQAARALRASLEKNTEITTATKHTTSQITAYETRARDLIANYTDTSEDSTPLASEQLIQALARATTRIAQAASTTNRRQTLTETIAKLNRQLDSHLGTDTQGQALRTQLAQGSTDQWQAQLAQLDTQIADADTQRQQLATDLGSLNKTLHDLETSANIPVIEDQIETLRTQLSNATRQWAIARIASSLVNDTLQQFVRERQPAVLSNASTMFAQVTEGAYTRVIQSDDASQLNVLDTRNRSKPTQALSRGTREQLYTCLRLALAQEYATQGVVLPMVLDDIMVNFDPPRAHALAELLINFSKSHQLLLFTCQPATVNLLQSIDPTLNIQNLPRFAGATTPA